MNAANSMVHCQLWMGGLEHYMTESFIMASFQRMGEKPLNVKVMRNKYSGEPAGYCFVHFENDNEAIDAMHKLNGKVIPNTNPAVRFRLNTATNQGKIMMNDREFSLWVGDLSSEVDDYTLYKTFAAKYPSIKAAKVILDASGCSKGFGFVRFGTEDEQKHCLTHMNGYKGLGSKPLKISNAIPKNQRATTANGQPAPQPAGTYQYPPDYSHYYDPNYWQNYSQWSGYGYDPNTGSYSYDPSSYAAQYSGQYPGQYGQYPPSSSQYPQQNYTSYPPATSYSSYYSSQPAPTSTAAAPAAGAQAVVAPPTAPPTAASAPPHYDSEVVEHSPPIDVEKENREYGEAILNFWVDMAFNAGLGHEFFEDEIEKLNMVEVTVPPVNIKLENKILAKKAIEAQGTSHQGSYVPSESTDSEDSLSREGSEEPEVKKRKLSLNDSKISPEDVSSNEEIEEKAMDSSEVTDEMEPDKKRKRDEAEEVDGETNLNCKMVKKDDQDLVNEESIGNENKVELEVDKVEEELSTEKYDQEKESQLAKEKIKEWNKVMGFMAAVDVDVLMAETESVSSESSNSPSEDSSDSEDISDKEGEKDELLEDKTSQLGEKLVEHVNILEGVSDGGLNLKEDQKKEVEASSGNGIDVIMEKIKDKKTDENDAVGDVEELESEGIKFPVHIIGNSVEQVEGEERYHPEDEDDEMDTGKETVKHTDEHNSTLSRSNYNENKSSSPSTNYHLAQREENIDDMDDMSQPSNNSDCVIVTDSHSTKRILEGFEISQQPRAHSENYANANSDDSPNNFSDQPADDLSPKVTKNLESFNNSGGDFLKVSPVEDDESSNSGDLCRNSVFTNPTNDDLMITSIDKVEETSCESSVENDSLVCKPTDHDLGVRHIDIDPSTKLNSPDSH